MGRNSTKCWPVIFSLFFWDNSGLDLQTFFELGSCQEEFWEKLRSYLAGESPDDQAMQWQNVVQVTGVVMRCSMVLCSKEGRFPSNCGDAIAGFSPPSYSPGKIDDL